jgi:hypothetical protein
MTKGKLLALDTPFEIKKKFGFGYKILIEPKQDSKRDFAEIKKEYVDPIILS